MDKDFRVGDSVCHIEYGNGFVTNIENKKKYSVRVKFDTPLPYIQCFTQSGFYIEPGVFPSLYHGKCEQVFGNVVEVLPERTVERFTNFVYENNKIESVCIYETKEEAEEIANSEFNNISYAAIGVAVKVPEGVV